MTYAARLPGRPHVLVVDDDIDAREIYEGTLRYAGYDVATAGSVAEAQRAVRARRPDLVVLDGRLPDGHGVDLLREWKRSTPMAQVPVVMITAFSGDDDIDRASHAGADAFVVKPCSGDALTSYLARVLRANAPTKKRPRYRMSPRRTPITLVYPCEDGGSIVRFHEHEGKLQARCRECLRGSPTLGRYPGEAEKRAVSLGWSARKDGWQCPVCIERKRTSRRN